MTVEEPEVSIYAIGNQTRQLLRVLIIGAFILGLWLIWRDMVPALDVFDRVTLWHNNTEASQAVNSPQGEQVRTVVKASPITLGDLLTSLLIVVVTVVAMRNAPGLLEMVMLQRLPLTPGVRFAITTMLKYFVTILGFVIAFNAIGIGWKKVQWLAAAITVGLGFGLQEIFANFVSGIIILFERPIRVGDTVTVGDTTGTVTRIRIRATTITDWDRKELIVPNKEFITSRLVNWTLSDTILRVVLKVGIAYGGDTDLAREAAAGAGADSPGRARRAAADRPVHRIRRQLPEFRAPRIHPEHRSLYQGPA